MSNKTGFSKVLLSALFLFLVACRGQADEVSNENSPGTEENVAVQNNISNKSSSNNDLNNSHINNLGCGCGGEKLTKKQLSREFINKTSDNPNYFNNFDKLSFYTNSWLLVDHKTSGDPAADLSGRYYSGFQGDQEYYEVLEVHSPFNKDVAQNSEAYKQGKMLVYSGFYVSNVESVNKYAIKGLEFVYEFSDSFAVVGILERADSEIMRTAPGENYENQSVNSMRIWSYNPDKAEVIEEFQTKMESKPLFSLFQLCGGGKLLRITYTSPEDKTKYDYRVIAFSPEGKILFNEHFSHQWYVIPKELSEKQCKGYTYLNLIRGYKKFAPEEFLIWNGNSFEKMN